MSTAPSLAPRRLRRNARAFCHDTSSVCAKLRPCGRELRGARQAVIRDVPAGLQPILSWPLAERLPSSKAHELKLEMRQKLEQGVPPDQILQAVFSRFGDKYRAVPLFEGIGTMVWLAPIGFVVVGLALAVAVVLRRKKASSRTSSPQEARVSPELQRAIDEELSKLD